MTEPTRKPAAPPTPSKTGSIAKAKGYLSARVDPLTSVFLVVPLFLIYQLGVLVLMDCDSAGACRWAGNGADLITRNLMRASNGSRLTYALIALVTALVLVGAALWARRSAKLHPRMFVPVIVESAIYASLVGPIIISLQRALPMGAPGQSTYLGDLIASCGAGLHEELVFRAGLFAGGLWALKKAGLKNLHAVLIAGLVSSVLFSAAHHIGPLGERFTMSAFVFRTLAGAIFAAIYGVRGFAIAAWTHALYDVWVFTLQRFA